MAGAETLLPLTMTLVRDGVIDMARAFDLLAANPARLLGVDAGVLSVGAQADIAIIDADKPWIVDRTRWRRRRATPLRPPASAGPRAQPVQGRDEGRLTQERRRSAKDRRLSRLAEKSLALAGRPLTGAAMARA
jgi:hypothetical protein